MPRPRLASTDAYTAAHETAIQVDRSDRTLLRFHGRDPFRMLQGLLSNDISGVGVGRGVYATVLTPKGKMIADARVYGLAPTELLLDAPPEVRDSLLGYFTRTVPPLFARFEDLTDSWGVLGVYGPAAHSMAGGVVGRPPPDEEDGFVTASLAGESAVLARTPYGAVDGYEIFAPRQSLEPVRRALSEAGAEAAGAETLEVLRIEAGRPRWGAELDETVIPLEAGLRERAISEGKGCYTGQEVIVRILHRGHVNRLLRGLLIEGDEPLAAGGELVRPGESKVVGRVTSACVSPRFGRAIALAYVRREVEPPATLQLAGDERTAQVVALPFPEHNVA
ncbi:MAG: YgfZ/GcvT domain-containing protein [Longimicrobiales bacterium]